MMPEDILPLDLSTVAILLDIDGTLLEFAPTPREVWVPPTLRQTLAVLADRTSQATALVSGRALADIDLIFAPLQLPAIGGHGAEFRPMAGGAAYPAASTLDQEIKRKCSEVAALSPGILLEDKGYSLALHYRLAPRLQETITEAVARICGTLHSSSIEILPGKYVIEIKPAAFSKATAVRRLMTIAPFKGRCPIFVGDDVTDEFVFSVMPELDGYAFSVGRTATNTDGSFTSPDHVRRWLAHVLETAAETSH